MKHLFSLLVFAFAASLYGQTESLSNTPLSSAENAVENDGAVQTGAIGSSGNFDPNLPSEEASWSLENAGEAAIEQAAKENEKTRLGLMHNYTKGAAMEEFKRRMRQAEVATVTRDFELGHFK